MIYISSPQLYWELAKAQHDTLLLEAQRSRLHQQATPRRGLFDGDIMESILSVCGLALVYYLLAQQAQL